MSDKPTYEELENRIHELEQTEKALQESEKKYRFLAKNMVDVVWIVDQDFQTTYVSPSVEKVLGFTVEERKRQTLEEMITPESLQRVRIRFLEEIERDKAGGCDPDRAVTIDVEYYRKDGSTVWLENNIKAMRNHTGEIVGMHGVSRDITERKQAEERLRESEFKFRSLFDLSPQAIALTDVATGRLIDINDKFCELTQYTKAELIGKTTTEAGFYSEEDRKIFINALQSSAEVNGLEMHFKAKDNSILTALMFARVIKIEERPLILTVFNDVTTQKQALEALHQERNFAENLIETAQVIILILDTAGRIVRFNPYLEALSGYALEEVRGKDWFSTFLPPINRDKIKSLFQRAIDNIQTQGNVNPIITRDGREILIEWYDKTLKDTDGNTIGLVSIGRDVTEHKKAEAALRESEEKYRLLVETANDAIFIAQDEVIKFPNPKTMEITGYSERELSEIPFLNLIHPEDREMVVGRYFQRLKGEHPPTAYSFRIINKAGDELWVQLNAALTAWENRPATINLIRDITEQRQLENQLRQSHKMESIGTLAGGIAHDFNNILGIILGNTELAMDDVPNWNPARLNLEEVKNASLRAKDVVRQLLSFARKTKLNKKPTSILPIVKESLKLLRSYIPTDIDIRHNIPENIDTILADPTQINQILINLFTNAHHAMPDGGIIEVTLENCELDEDRATQYPGLQPGRYARLIVRDTGQGIVPKNIDHIFDPYFTTKDVGKGTGMGLAVVHGIVKEHNGVITAQSTPGKGTTFDLLFPAVTKEPVVEIGADEDLPAGYERILLIDDEEPIVRLGRQRLEKLGYSVEAITNPMEALAIFKSTPDAFDLAITDMTMPNMTGDRLAQELLKIRPDIPIIICTGFSEKMSPVKARQLGIKAFLMKPVEKIDLAQTVRKVLDTGPNET
jgi:PAS domain S-box-containing protein